VLVRLLGPVGAEDDGQDLALGAPMQRALFAMLALGRGRVVSTDALIDGLWGESPPSRPLASLQVYVHGLRRALNAVPGGRDRLESRSPGYRLAVADDELDLGIFQTRWDRARSLSRDGKLASAAATLGAALELWREPALADVRALPFAEAVVVQLDETYLLAREDHIDLRLACGEHAAIIPDLERLVAEHPTRERLWGQLMIGLYRADRQVDALATYGRARDRLADELGIDPGEALRALEIGILRQDPQLGAPRAPAPAVAQPSAPGVAVRSPVGPADAEGARPREHARVPRVLTPTIGREDLLRELVDRVGARATQVLSLIGPGGSGKTRLASELAARINGVFAGGVYFLSAGEGQDGAELLTALSLAVGGSEPAETSIATSAQAVADALPAEPVLVVLDNLESAEHAAEAVAALASRAPAAFILATSRIPLRLNSEHVVMVPPLPTPPSPEGSRSVVDTVAFPAVELFVERSRAASRTFVLGDENLADVAELCRLLDGIPLALELAAARMRYLTPGAALSRLRRSLDLLSSTSVDIPQRQRTLDGTIAWSIAHLPPPARRLLEEIVTVFEDGFDLEALEAIGAETGDAAADSVLDPLEELGALVDAGLVRLKDTRVELRYQLLTTVSSHVARNHPLPPERNDALRARHLDWLTVRLTRWSEAIDGPEGDVVLARFADEQTDIVSLLEWAVTQGRAEEAAGLALPAAEAWLASGRLRLGDEWLARIAARPLTAHSADALALARARLAYHLGDAPATESLCRTVLNHASADLETTARCYLAAACVAQGRQAEGRADAEAALASARAAGEETIQAIALAVLAIAAAMDGDFATEKALYEERLAVVRRRGDRARIADTLNTLAEIALDAGDAAGARDHVEEALRLAGPHRQLERRDALITAARASCLGGEQERMCAELAEALDIATRTEQPLALAQIARTLAGALAARGAAGEALRLYAVAHHLAPSPGGGPEPMESDLARGYATACAALTPGEQERHRLLGSSSARSLAAAAETIGTALAQLPRSRAPGPAPLAGLVRE